MEIDELIPLWISIFLNDFGAQLKQNKQRFQINIIRKLRIYKNSFSFYLIMKYLFPSKADFQIWIHQVFPISIPSKDLFYCLNKGIIHCNTRKQSRGFSGVVGREWIRLCKLFRNLLVTYFVAYLQHGRPWGWVWPIALSHQLAPKDYSLCHPAPHLSLSFHSAPRRGEEGERGGEEEIMLLFNIYLYSGLRILWFLMVNKGTRTGGSSPVATTIMLTLR